MENPQRMPSLPMRSASVEADDVDLLATAQPERRRRYEQIRGGPFRATFYETSWGSAGLARESWSCGVRVRCDRPSEYVVFSVHSTKGDFRWCGASVEPGALLRVDEPWEMTTTLPLGFVCFALDRAALQAVETHLTGAECALPVGNRKVAGIDFRLGQRLANMLAALATAQSEPAALAAAEADLLRLGARLDLAAGLLPLDRLPHPSRRRAAVRRVEEYLDAQGDRGPGPSIPALCAVAGVSERTLEYAFREQLSTTPVRFLMLRRLNRVRRDLLAAEQGATVTQIMLRAGVYDLGRFAGEYRQLFGELPSDTLRRGSGAAALKKPLDPPRYLAGGAGDLGIRRRREGVEAQGALWSAGADAIEDQRVEVDVEVQRIAEALHEGDGAALRADEAPVVPGPAAQGGKHGADEDPKHVLHQGRVVGEPVAKVPLQ